MCLDTIRNEKGKRKKKKRRLIPVVTQKLIFPDGDDSWI